MNLSANTAAVITHGFSRTADAAGRQWTYDPECGCRYVYLSDKSVAYTVEAGKGVNIDYAADGQVVGIEFL